MATPVKICYRAIPIGDDVLLLRSPDSDIVEEANIILNDYFNKKKSNSPTNLMTFDEVDSKNKRKINYDLDYLLEFKDKQFKIDCRIEDVLADLHIKRGDQDSLEYEDSDDSQNEGSLMRYFLNKGRFNYTDRNGRVFPFGRTNRRYSNENGVKSDEKRRMRNSIESVGSNGSDEERRRSLGNNGARSNERRRTRNPSDAEYNNNNRSDVTRVIRKSVGGNGHDGMNERRRNTFESNGVKDYPARSYKENARASEPRRRSNERVNDQKYNVRDMDTSFRVNSSPIDSQTKDFSFNENDLIDFSESPVKNVVNTDSNNNSKSSSDSNIEEIEGKFKRGVFYNSTFRGALGFNQIGRSFDVRDLIKLK